MAKSLRSKWRRKCRAVKRERYGAKELDKLKKTLGIDENSSAEIDMKDITEIATVVDAKTIKESSKENVEEMEKMDEDGKRVYSSKTLRDQHGNYPVWMSKRKIIKNKKGRAKSKKASAKQTKRLTKKEKKKLQKKAT